MQTEYHGFDSIKNLSEIVEKENAQDIFLVTGRKSFETCGARKCIDRILPQYKRFSDISPNPKLEQIKIGLKEFEKGKYDLIIGIGGGSVIDVAKAIKMFYFERTEKKVPLVAIPTTAGSGSEATDFIVYYIEKKKQSAGAPNLTLPDYAICDPALTLNLPRNIASASGIDALGQAMESYWSINSNNSSKEFASESIRLCIRNLEKSVNHSIKESKENMMKSANLSGKAINITKTTACHSIAYPITSYFKVPHGHAVGLTLGEMLVYNSNVKNDCNDKRGVEYVRRTINELCWLLEVNNAEEARDKIKKLMNSIGLETRLSELGINEWGIKLIIENGFSPERVKNNPRLLTEENLRKILSNIY